MCETWAYKKGTSRDNNYPDDAAAGNSERKTIYLPKAAHFRKHRANSCPTEADGHNFDWLQKVQNVIHS